MFTYKKGGSLLTYISQHPRILATLMATLLAGATLGGYLQGRDAALHDVEERLDERAHASRDRVDGVLSQYRNIPFFTAQANWVVQLFMNAKPCPGQDSVALGNTYLERLAGTTGAEAIYLMNTDGLVMAASNYRSPVSFLGKNYGFRVYFRQALEQGKFEQVAKGVTSKMPGYYFSHAVRIDGKARGVVAAKVSLDEIEAKLEWKNGSASPSAILADPRGVVLMPKIWRFQTLQPLSRAERQSIIGEKQYEGEELKPLALTRLDKVNGLTRIRFASEPDRILFEKAYPIPNMGWLYLYEDTTRYRATLWLHSVLGFAAGLVAVLLTYLALQRRSSREALLQTALHDPLTGLYTRLYMNDVLPHICAAHNRDSDRAFAVAMFDLDHFKQVNDTHGHLAGDAVLRGVAGIIQQQVRRSDYPMRFGGEELLLVITPCPDVAGALVVAERIRHAVAEASFQCGDETLHITLSAGITLHQSGETVDQLIARADQKLYQAKHAGRNQVCA